MECPPHELSNSLCIKHAMNIDQFQEPCQTLGMLLLSERSQTSRSSKSKPCGLYSQHRGQLYGIRSFLPLLQGFQGSNSGCQGFPARVFASCSHAKSTILFLLSNLPRGAGETYPLSEDQNSVQYLHQVPSPAPRESTLTSDFLDTRIHMQVWIVIYYL